MKTINSSGLFILKDGESVPYSISKERVIVCGVPGAFTPGCTNRHLPGFAKNIVPLHNKGIKKIVFVSVNDPYVMKAWSDAHGSQDIDCVADPLAVFSKSIGKDVDYGETLGTRCERFAFLIEDHKIIQEFTDPFIEGVLQEL